MVAPFAAIEALIDQGVDDMLTNAEAVYTPKARLQSITIPVIFESSPYDPLDLSQGTQTRIDVLRSHVPALAKGDTFVIRGQIYKVEDPGKSSGGRAIVLLKPVSEAGNGG